MIKDERIEQIKSLLHRTGNVGVAQLCDLLEVSPMTVRRDLEVLEDMGVLVRTHGGARLPESRALLESPFEERLKVNQKEKRAIGKEASDTVFSGEKLFIGSGSTLHFLGTHLGTSKELFVVTDSLHIATKLIHRPNISLIMVGGELRSNTLSATGILAEQMVEKLLCEKAYMSVTTIDRNGNLYLGSIAAVGVFSSQYRTAPTCYLLVDSSKFGRKDFVHVGKLRPGVTLITDIYADQELLEIYRAMGVEIMLARPEDRG